MNPGAGNMAEWIKSAYDKLALAVVLLALLLSVAFLGVYVDRENKQLAAARVRQPELERNNSRPPDVGALHAAIESLADPFQVDAAAKPMLVAELRVGCDKCGRPIPPAAEICPFRNCGAIQAWALAKEQPTDADADLMPDEWEREHGLDAMANDARKDADGDRWTNLEEFKAAADPRDAGSHPPPVDKLRWIRTQWTTLPFSFQSVMHPAPDQNVFVLKNKRLDRDFYVKLGDTIEGGYEVVSYEGRTATVTRAWSAMPVVEDVSVLTLRKVDKVIPLIRGQDAQRGELAAELIYLIDKTKYPVKVNFVVALNQDKYKVVDIQANLVVVSNISTGAKNSLGKFSESDLPSGEDNRKAGPQDATDAEARDN